LDRARLTEKSTRKMTQMTLSYALSSWIVSSSSGNIIVTMMKSDKAVRTRMKSS